MILREIVHAEKSLHNYGFSRFHLYYWQHYKSSLLARKNYLSEASFPLRVSKPQRVESVFLSLQNENF